MKNLLLLLAVMILASCGVTSNRFNTVKEESTSISIFGNRDVDTKYAYQVYFWDYRYDVKYREWYEQYFQYTSPLEMEMLEIYTPSVYINGYELSKTVSSQEIEEILATMKQRHQSLKDKAAKAIAKKSKKGLYSPAWDFELWFQKNYYPYIKLQSIEGHEYIVYDYDKGEYILVSLPVYERYYQQGLENLGDRN